MTWTLLLALAATQPTIHLAVPDLPSAAACEQLASSLRTTTAISPETFREVRAGTVKLARLNRIAAAAGASAPKTSPPTTHCIHTP